MPRATTKSNTRPQGLKREAVELLERREAKRSKPAPIHSNRYRKKTKPFRFLDLPSELRNMIYELAAQQSTAFVKGRQLTDRSGLLEVSAQLREEYLPILILNAPKIQIEVTNFDFRHAVTFINRLSTIELSTLPTTTTPSTRKIEVMLVISKGATKNQALLRRWLNRAGNTTKKGTSLDISYKLVRSHPACFRWAAGYIVTDDPVCFDWVIVLDVYKQFNDNAVANAEADKKRAVFDGPVRTRT